MESPWVQMFYLNYYDRLILKVFWSWTPSAKLFLDYTTELGREINTNCTPHSTKHCQQ